MTYVTLHLVNHSLGHISIEAMQSMLTVMSAIWSSIPGAILLYGALFVHVVLALWKITNLRSLWLAPWQWVQIVLGVAIPYMLITHILVTRAAENLLDVNVDYPYELAFLWPENALLQNLMLLVVWTHGIVGMHFWLRLRDWYQDWRPVLAAVSVVIPSLSITGWLTAAKLQAGRTAALSQDGTQIVTAEQQEVMNLVINTFWSWDQNAKWAIIGIVILIVTILTMRFALASFGKRARVDYGDGKIVNATPGQTLLEVSRGARIPHMSVCGGRARCSTCRTMILSDPDELGARTDAESRLLDKLNAGPNVRLACQTRVFGNMEVRPLVQPHQQLTTRTNIDPLGWGVEKDVAVLFLDIRGFSKISEKSLPYDIVFILNALFGEVATKIEDHNGFVDKFMGDGLMAIFGINTTAEQASRDALLAAIDCQAASRTASRMLTPHLDEPIRIGIGIHTGQVVLGRIGKTADQKGPSRLTAIGETVNIAARLESATKDLKAEIVVSQATNEQAGMDGNLPSCEQSKINVHNISQPIDVIAIKDAAEFGAKFGK